ncbi:MAG: hypothetical protein ACKO26_10675, partial [Planctomycetota bacterium]
MHRSLQLVGLTAILCLAPNAFAGWPVDAEQRQKTVGEPQSLKVEPASIDLIGKRSRRQVLVTGSYAEQVVRDLTGLAA